MADTRCLRHNATDEEIDLAIAVVNGEDCGEDGDRVRDFLVSDRGVPWETLRPVLCEAITPYVEWSENPMFPHKNTTRSPPDVARIYDPMSSFVGAPLEVSRWSKNIPSQSDKNLSRAVFGVSFPSASVEVTDAVIMFIRKTSVMHAFYTGHDIDPRTLGVTHGVRVPQQKWNPRPLFIRELELVISCLDPEVLDGVEIKQLVLEATRVARYVMVRRALQHGQGFRAVVDGISYQLVFYCENEVACFFDTTCSFDPPRNSPKRFIPECYQPAIECANPKCVQRSMGVTPEQCKTCMNARYCNKGCLIAHSSEHKRICFQVDLEEDAYLDEGSIVPSTILPKHIPGSCWKEGCDSKGTLSCSQCMKAKYCSATCQKSNWCVHKTVCKAWSI